ncbi:uncharacterized protein ACA1_285520 [Acanthamoeba castellanii str. Neff]|uniref:Reverse transcriptase domain-containing protein n=1 Tax=Acanthamoeba castellanii (strain ATCC 30010 / Neff) TaxID=1257118 RepID=L8H8Y1_ACACF|nr:uncharacterized protein ACA1_285520 [Acanthamoeba castellanii str. Neff]ELR21193.1 hypothetical protein ACA1_285520 [Acanthamoeba castellanii str. Neff]
MDDIIVMAHSQEEALQAHNTTLSTLANLSWVVNWDKSSLKPSQAKEFLGLIINTTSEPQFQNNWDSQIQLTPAVVCDLKEWSISLTKWDGRVATLHPFDEVLDTNASLGGWGAALKGLSTTSMGWWKQLGHHINKLELKAVHHAIKSLLPLLKGSFSGVTM